MGGRVQPQLRRVMDGRTRTSSSRRRPFGATSPASTRSNVDSYTTVRTHHGKLENPATGQRSMSDASTSRAHADGQPLGPATEVCHLEPPRRRAEGLEQCRVSSARRASPPPDRQVQPVRTVPAAERGLRSCALRREAAEPPAPVGRRRRRHRHWPTALGGRSPRSTSAGQRWPPVGRRWRRSHWSLRCNVTESGRPGRPGGRGRSRAATDRPARLESQPPAAQHRRPHRAAARAGSGGEDRLIVTRRGGPCSSRRRCPRDADPAAQSLANFSRRGTAEPARPVAPRESRQSDDPEMTARDTPRDALDLERLRSAGSACRHRPSSMPPNQPAYSPASCSSTGVSCSQDCT